MNFHRLNWLGVVVAAICTMVVGFLWYSAILFANAWMREMGHDPNDKAKIQEMQKTAGLAYTGSFLASLVSASTLALFLHWLRAEGLHTLRHQHRLPACLLPGHGNDPRRVEVALQPGATKAEG